jgi:hypothetical protein
LITAFFFLHAGSNYDSDTGDWNQATFVLGFDISGTIPKPFGYAEIPGSPLNQYSTDLYQDHLRVVTTENNWRLENDRTKNKIFVLKLPEASEDASSEMIKVGESGHVGKPNEAVYSVRFIGPRAYIVTFERIDPFYIYDLSDPTDPTKLGELEVRYFFRTPPNFHLNPCTYPLDTDCHYCVTLADSGVQFLLASDRH